jgi:hypothetical protein
MIAFGYILRMVSLVRFTVSMTLEKKNESTAQSGLIL